jgi:hypothetical protein
MIAAVGPEGVERVQVPLLLPDERRSISCSDSSSPAERRRLIEIAARAMRGEVSGG